LLAPTGTTLSSKTLVTLQCQDSGREKTRKCDSRGEPVHSFIIADFANHYLRRHLYNSALDWYLTVQMLKYVLTTRRFRNEKNSMNKCISTILATTLLSLSMTAMAAKPTRIGFETDGIAPDGAEYSIYIVKCSNGHQQPITAWDKRKTWCVGSESKENCYNKQIKAAKKACKI
jgi:hypothetical protein